MKRILIINLLLLSVSFSTIAQQKYEPTWTSLRKHKIPQWLIDAKFGIYSHVSFETIRNIPGNEKKFDHELIKDFKLEKFKAADWADLYVKAGAKFAGPVSWHGSGYVHWDSDLTKFNVVDMGPKFDLLGELSREIRKRDLKVITSFHTGYWYHRALDRENPGMYDPQYVELYGPAHDDSVQNIVAWKNHVEKQSKFTQEFDKSMIDKMNEAVDKYHPDIAWVDVSFGGTVRAFNKGRYKDGKLVANEDIYIGGHTESNQRNFISNFYNDGLNRKSEVEFVYKEYDVPPGVGMRNFENGLIDQLTYDTWMTDIDMCDPVSWFYKEGMGIKDANLIVDILVDVTAKNGVLLLNVPPKPDGTFADYIKNELYQIGDWLKINGEAIYGTMPWTIYGEGPSSLAKTGHYSESKRNASYTEKDFRFTQKDNTLYAICMDVPAGEIFINSLGTRGRLYEGDILSISLLGSKERLKYSQSETGLSIEMPKNFTGKYSTVFKIQRKP
jgi:alpha-L-fucosidase